MGQHRTSDTSQRPAPRTSPLPPPLSRSFHNPHAKINSLWQHPQSCLDPPASQLLDPKNLPNLMRLVPPSGPQAVAGRTPHLPEQPSPKIPLPSPGSQPAPICSPCVVEKASLPLPNKHLGFEIQLACVISEPSPRRGETQPGSPTLSPKAEPPLHCPKTSARGSALPRRDPSPQRQPPALPHTPPAQRGGQGLISAPREPARGHRLSRKSSRAPRCQLRAEVTRRTPRFDLKAAIFFFPPSHPI